MNAWTRDLVRERGEILALIVNANIEIDRLRAEVERLTADLALVRDENLALRQREALA